VQPTSELVTAHDPKNPEMTDREMTRAVIFPNNKKISKLCTNPQTAGRVRVRVRRDEARQATEEEERACKPLLFSHFRR
jgi:hypothetical protein